MTTKKNVTRLRGALRLDAEIERLNAFMNRARQSDAWDAGFRPAFEEGYLLGLKRGRQWLRREINDLRKKQREKDQLPPP